jgi:hypothetical protein
MLTSSDRTRTRVATPILLPESDTASEPMRDEVGERVPPRPASVGDGRTVSLGMSAVHSTDQLDRRSSHALVALRVTVRCHLRLVQRARSGHAFGPRGWHSRSAHNEQMTSRTTRLSDVPGLFTVIPPIQLTLTTGWRAAASARDRMYPDTEAPALSA